MSLALFGLFLLCVASQAVTGWSAYDSGQKDAHLPQIGLLGFLGTGHFLDGVFSNWQAAILQLAVLVAFGSVLRQRGAAHSRKADPPSPRTLKLKLRPRESLGQWAYANSLSLALGTLFIVCFFLHILFGTWSYNEEQALRHLPTVAIGRYVLTADFWSSAFECWEAEFGAIAIYIIFSIFLRQENSPESKPVEAADSTTGETNE